MIGYILRPDYRNVCNIPMTQTPEGRKRRATWKPTLEKKQNETWTEVHRASQSSNRQRRMAAHVCDTLSPSRGVSDPHIRLLRKNEINLVTKPYNTCYKNSLFQSSGYPLISTQMWHIKFLLPILLRTILARMEGFFFQEERKHIQNVKTCKIGIKLDSPMHGPKPFYLNEI